MGRSSHALPLRWRHAGATLGAFAFALLIAGCKVGPNFHSPQTETPESWYGPVPENAGAGRVDLSRWWASFDDPVLDSMVERAMASNLDLKQAEARLREARALRGVVAAGLFPTVDVGGSYSRTSAEIPKGSFRDFARGRNLFRAGFDAAWELDIFGGVRRDIEASEADIQAAVEDRRDVLVTLVSEVAQDYTDLRGFQQQLVIARQNLDAQQHSVRVTEERLRAGLIGRLDVANAQAQAATTESQIPQIESSIQQAIYALGVLLGKPPAALADELSPPAAIPAAAPRVPVGLPSDLLRRRPDIRRAEAQLHAATARIGVATADLFPRFSLTGSLGLESDQLASLVNWGSRSYSFGPSVSWPIFDAGRIMANVRVQNAREEQALITYQKTVLTAMQDTETALIALAKESRHRAALEKALAANREAVDLSTTLYTHGQTDFLNVLQAQRSLYSTQDALVQSDRARASDLIALYKALGGGWDFEAASSPPPASQPDRPEEK
jgi:NodT family efflux transporter outer membrane factor (OMF) lipoprotein